MEKILCTLTLVGRKEWDPWDKYTLVLEQRVEEFLTS